LVCPFFKNASILMKNMGFLAILEHIDVIFLS